MHSCAKRAAGEGALEPALDPDGGANDTRQSGGEHEVTTATGRR